MGQIVFNEQKPKYCNLIAITTGSKKDYVIPDGEIWLIDTTNSSKTAGNGKYDYYIVGDNSHTASQLAETKIRIDDSDIIIIDNAPISGSNNAVSSGGVFSALENKQSTITDISDIRSGASAGATAYQKPGSGIPPTDLSKSVRDSLAAADAAAPQSSTYTKVEVNNLIVPQGIGAIPVTELPSSGNTNTLYFLQGEDSFTVNAWNGSAWITLATMTGTLPPVKVGNIDGYDFALMDSYNNALVLFKDGHIITKNFNSKDSSEMKVANIDDADFMIMDDSNNAIALFKDGHIQTKNFNSKDAASGGNISKYRGKRLGIIGDSISTFSGTMPSGYATFYPNSNVDNVNKLWWKIVATNLDMTTVNRSWSGSRVCGNGTSTSSAQAGCSTKRVNDLTEDNVVPDVIIIWMGINDFGYPTNNWTPLGDFGKSSKELPTDSDNVSTFSEGYGILVSKVMSTYPRAKVFCCTLMQTGYATKDHKTTGVWPTENLGGITLEEYNERIREIAHCLGASIIDLASCGIHFWNFSNYTIDQLHPNEAGQAIVGNFITTQLLNNI